MAEHELTPTPDEALEIEIHALLTKATALRDRFTGMIADGKPTARTVTRMNTTITALNEALATYHYDVVKRRGTKPGPKTRANAQYERDLQ